MTFAPSFLDELRNRLSIDQIVGRRVRLIKRGREQTGLCPFHNEKTPSFTVSQEKGFYHCFGCGAHGDVIGFVMRGEGLSFPEAVERLAQEAGLAIPEIAPGDRERASRATALGAVLEAAAKWFESQLASASGAEARRYLTGRGLAPETIARFRLGLAPAGRVALKEAMIARDLPEALLIEAGLLFKPEDGGASFDRFRDRIMFPIADRRGRIIAFGGRALAEAHDRTVAKYLNSPETPLFHKGRTLYNLALAREAARTAGTVVVAEGYMDVIALAQAGFDHAVAPLGTALTEDQMIELWRLAAEPILCFDGDAAGGHAAERAAERALPLLQPGRSFRFATLPAGLDPDDFIRQSGASAMAAVLAAASPLADVLWRKATDNQNFDTPERRAALRKALDDLASAIADGNVQGYYRQHFADRLAAAFGARREAQSAASPFRPRGPVVPPGSNRPVPPPTSSRREQVLLAAIINHAELLNGHEDEISQISLLLPELDRLRGAILDVHAQLPGLDSDALRRHLVEAGQGELVAWLLRSEVTRLYRFVQSDTPLAEVEADWKQALALQRKAVDSAQLREEGAAFGQDMTEAKEGRFLALKRQLASGEGVEADPSPVSRG